LPNKLKEVSPLVKSFCHCQFELYIKDGVICRGQRSVVPQSAKENILKIIHTSHRGIVTNKTKAREYFYWPNMNADVEETVNSCELCQKYKNSNTYEPILDRELPKRPWEKIGGDFFELSGKHYLLVVDYSSKYIELQLMQGTTANSLIIAFKNIFARFGIPDEIVSDRGPPFNSAELKTFYAKWNISFNLSTPGYSR